MRGERSRQNEPMGLVDCQQLLDGRFCPSQARVVVEKELSIFINGEQFAVASVTPVMEKEFVIGYLFGQGFIASIEDVEAIEIDSNAARVIVKGDRISQRAAQTEYRIVSGGGKSAFFGEASFPRIQTTMKLRVDNIFKAISAVFERGNVYKETGGVHASGLFTPDAEPICIVEDIGRHNTLDKAIGYALINHVDCTNTFLASTGRMASEMVLKICRARIPVAATKTAVTKFALEIGEKYGLTIIGFVRDTGTKIRTDMEVRTVGQRGMRIYTSPERVLL